MGEYANLRDQSSNEPATDKKSLATLFDDKPATDKRALATLFEDAPDNSAVAAKLNLHIAADTKPDEAAEAAKLAKRYRLPVGVVSEFRDDYAQRAQLDDGRAAIDQSPAVRTWVAANPRNADIAHDDLPALASVDQAVNHYTFRNAAKKGVAGLKLTLDFLADRLANSVGADTTETQRILQDTAGFYRAQGADPQLAAAGQRAKDAGGGTWYGTLRHLPGEVASEENPFQVLGKFVTEQLPAALVGFGVGAAATAPVRAAVVNRVSSALVAKGVNTAIAGAAGNSTAVVMQSLGVNYNEGLEQGLPPDDAVSRAWTKTLSEVPANAVAGAAMGLKIGPNQLTNIIGQAAVQGAGGGVGATLAAHSVGEEADPVEVALEILGEAVSAGPEVATLTLSKIARSKSVQTAQAATAAVEDAQALGEIVKAADASALKRRDPATFAEFVDQAKPDAVVYLAPEHLANLDLSAVPEIAAQAAEAQATGGDVQIRLSDLVAHLPGEQLLPHLRTQPEAMTAAEAQQFDGVAAMTSELNSAPATTDQMLQSADQAGMDADTWAQYQSAAAVSAQAAIEQRDARLLRDMQWLENAKSAEARALNTEAQMLRSTLEAEVAAEIQNNPDAYPEHAVQRWLKTGALPDGAQTVGAKLNTAALREMYGDGPAAPWRYLASNMLTAEDGLHPDVVAEMFGYASGDDMVRAIVAAEPQASLVSRMAEERLMEQRPDIADAIARERSAEALIADRARERFLATEAAALAQAVGNRVLLANEARQYAEESIARRKVRDVRPAQFKASAARAGRAAAEAFSQGDTLKAAKWKQSEVLQSALQTEATSATAEVAQALASFKRMQKSDDGGRDGNLANTARAILAQYGLAASDKTAADYLEQVQHYDPELHADLLVLMEGMPGQQTDYRDMTVADFRAMRDRVQAVWSLARSTREMEIDGQRIEIATAAEALASQLATEPAAERETMVGTNAKLDLRMRIAGMKAALRRVEFWSDARDRGDKKGPFRTYIWQPVSEAVTRYRTQRNEYVNRFLELLKTIEPTLKPGKISAPELADGMVFADRSALLHALLHLGNKSNQRKLLLGYRWATENEDGSLDTSRWDKFLNRMHTEKRITKADWDFVQATWALLEELKPSAQAAHKKMFGSYFAEITADPLQTPFGEYAGGYVPAVTDNLLVPESRSHGAMDDLLAGQNSPMFPAVNRGFTRGRIEDYTRPLALDLRQIPAHIDKVSRFATLGPVLRDAARLVTRNRAFRSAMDAVDPTAVESMLVPWLKRVATQTLNRPSETQADRAVARIANTLRNRTGLLMMSGNVVNTLQQITGFSVASLKVKPRHLAGGMLEFIRNPTKVAQAINELSPWMLQRSDSSAHEVDQAVNDLLTNPGALKQAEQLGTKYGYALQQLAQNFIDRVVWLGAYRQAEADGMGDTQAVRDADSAVRMTQSSFAPEDASKVEHANAFTRMFLQFYSYFNGQANLIATEGKNAQGSAARLALVYLLGFAVPAFTADLLVKAVRGDLLKDDEDGDELAARLLAAFFMSQTRYFMGSLPVVSNVGNALLGRFTPERFDDRIGASPVYSAVEATVRAPWSIARAVQGEGNPKDAVRDGLTAVAVLTGIPTGALIRPLSHLADEDKSEVTLSGLLTGKAQK